MNSIPSIIDPIRQDFFDPFVYGRLRGSFAIWYGHQIKQLGYTDQKVPLKIQLVNKVFLATALLALALIALNFTFYGLLLSDPSSRINEADSLLRRATETGRIEASALFRLIEFIQEARIKPEIVNSVDLARFNNIEQRVNALPEHNHGQGITVEIPRDGDCLFWAFFNYSYLKGSENRAASVEEERARAVQLQEALYESHEPLRNTIAVFCTERNWQNPSQYFREMRQPRRYWGDDPEIMALSQIHNLEVLVYDVSRNHYQSIHFHGAPRGRIVLEYVNRSHYNLILRSH